MNEICRPSILVLVLFLLNCSVYVSTANAQIGLHAPVYGLSKSSDSSSVSFPNPVLPIRNWRDSSDQYFKLKHDKNEIDVWRYMSPNAFPTDPFKIDRRGSSYYVPGTVRDELNLIMNRPRDSAFIPVLPAAFLALQLAGQYLLVQQKTEITAEDVHNARDGLPVLVELWKQNPQTLSELYKTRHLKDNYTMLELQRLVDLLMDNKLVRRKLIEKSETQYFYAIDKIKYDLLVEQLKTEQPVSPSKIKSSSIDFKNPNNK
jgi:hypothetical protein